MSSRNSERTVYSIAGKTLAIVTESQDGTRRVYRNGVELPCSDAVLSSIAREAAKDGRSLTVTHNGVTSHFKR